MKEKVSQKIIENYNELINKLEDYSNCQKDNEEEKLRHLTSFIAYLVANTDFEEDIVNNDLEKYYGKDKALMSILNKREDNILQSALKEPKSEILKIRLAQISNELYHYLENENILKIKNVNINKLSLKFQIFLKQQNLNLSDVEKEFFSYNLKYINKKEMGNEMKKFVDFMSANGIKKEENGLDFYKDFLHFFEKSEIIKNMKELKENMTSQIVKYPNNVKIFRENDNQEIGKEKSYRLYIVEKNGYLYTQFHSRKNLIDKIPVKYASYIEDNKVLDKRISPSIGVNLNEDERNEYENNKNDIENKEYVFYYDNFVKKKGEKEIGNDK